MDVRRKEGTSFPERTGAGANLTFIENVTSGVRLDIVHVLRSIVSSSFYKREDGGEVRQSPGGERCDPAQVGFWNQPLPLPLGVLPATSPHVSIPISVASAEESAPLLKVMCLF